MVRTGHQDVKQLGLGAAATLEWTTGGPLTEEAPMVERERVLGDAGGTEPQEAVEVLTPSLHCQHQQGCREEHL